MAKKTLQLVKEIAHRMRFPNRVEHVASQNAIEAWEPQFLAGGSPGLIVLFSELANLFPDEKWDEAVHFYILKIKQNLEEKWSGDLSLFNGLSGICFAIQTASKQGTRYQKILTKLDQFLLERVQTQYINPINTALSKGYRLHVDYYDLMSGIIGIGVYALKNKRLARFTELTEKILKTLIELIKPIEIQGVLVPGWYLPSEYQMLEEEKKFYPNGSFNFGLAHGVTGILAFFAIASIQGFKVSGLQDCIGHISHYLIKNRRQLRGSYFWDTIISFEDEVRSLRTQNCFFRDAWCYGSPSVSRALFLAGKALQESEIQSFAIESFKSIFSRTMSEWNIPGPTFCHGLSGLLSFTHLFAIESKDNDLVEKAAFIEARILELYHPNHPFGFQDQHLIPNRGLIFVDSPGLLQGAAGVLLSLLTRETGCQDWMWPFMINDGCF